MCDFFWTPSCYTIRLINIFIFPGSRFLCWCSKPNWDKLKSKGPVLIWTKYYRWPSGKEAGKNHMASIQTLA